MLGLAGLSANGVDVAGDDSDTIFPVFGFMMNGAVVH